MDGERLCHPDALGHRGIDQAVEALVSEQLQHCLDVGVARPDVPRDEAFSAPQQRGGSGRGHGLKAMLTSRMRWHFHLTPAADGAANMALDEALMRRAARTGERSEERRVREQR